MSTNVRISHLVFGMLNVIVRDADVFVRIISFERIQRSVLLA